MITPDEVLDNLLPAGPCADCGQHFEGKLLDDNRLCMDCDRRAYDKAWKAERDADAAAAAADKKRKEDNERYELQHARFEKEREDNLRKENERIEKDLRAFAAEGRKAR